MARAGSAFPQALLRSHAAVGAHTTRHGHPVSHCEPNVTVLLLHRHVTAPSASRSLHNSMVSGQAWRRGKGEIKSAWDNVQKNSFKSLAKASGRWVSIICRGGNQTLQKLQEALQAQWKGKVMAHVRNHCIFSKAVLCLPRPEQTALQKCRTEMLRASCKTQGFVDSGKGSIRKITQAETWPGKDQRWGTLTGAVLVQRKAQKRC